MFQNTDETAAAAVRRTGAGASRTVGGAFRTGAGASRTVGGAFSSFPLVTPVVPRSWAITRTTKQTHFSCPKYWVSQNQREQHHRQGHLPPTQSTQNQSLAPWSTRSDPWNPEHRRYPCAQLRVAQNLKRQKTGGVFWGWAMSGSGQGSLLARSSVTISAGTD